MEGRTSLQAAAFLFSLGRPKSAAVVEPQEWMYLFLPQVVNPEVSLMPKPSLALIVFSWIYLG